MPDPEFCPRCGSGNIEESEAVVGFWICEDCDYKWRIKKDGEVEPEQEDSTEEDSKEDSEGDGLMMGDSMFPPENFDSE